MKNTKEAIRQAFIDLYKIKGVDQITVDMICKKAYVSRSTFYNHYPSVDILVSELETEVADEMKRIYQDYNYQDIFEIDPRYPSPNFIEMFRCVLRFKDFFIGAYSEHGNPSFISRSKKMSAQNLRNSIEKHKQSAQNIDIICDICSDYIITCCNMIIKYEGRLSPKGLAIEVKKQIVDFVNNEDLYIEGKQQ